MNEGNQVKRNVELLSGLLGSVGEEIELVERRIAELQQLLGPILMPEAPLPQSKEDIRLEPQAILHRNHEDLRVIGYRVKNVRVMLETLNDRVRV